MKLLIISGTAHYRRDGQIVGHGPTVREISHLASLFDQVEHLAFLYDGPAPANMLPYESERVRVIPVAPSGGENMAAKLGILALAPTYVAAMLRALPQAGVIHVRTPANISLMALIVLALARHPARRWIKYAGNWNPAEPDWRSYTFQRWWLTRNFSRAHVTVNGTWPDQPAHVTPFYNPSLREADLAPAAALVVDKQLTDPLRLLFVGELNHPKGVGRALEILARLKADGVEATLDLVGDGPERPTFEAQARTLGVEAQARFHGWLPRDSIAPLYALAHLLLLPTSSSEGWPKVLSEGMAYGVVPLAGAISSIPQYLREFQTGRALESTDIAAFAAAIQAYRRDPDLWQREAANGLRAARLFTYEYYLERVRALLDLGS